MSLQTDDDDDDSEDDDYIDDESPGKPDENMKGVDEKVGEEVGEEDNANNYLAWYHSAFPLLSEDNLDKEGAAKAADATARAGLHDQARMNHDRNPHGDSHVERGSHVYVVYVWAGKDGDWRQNLRQTTNSSFN